MIIVLNLSGVIILTNNITLLVTFSWIAVIVVRKPHCHSAFQIKQVVLIESIHPSTLMEWNGTVSVRNEHFVVFGINCVDAMQSNFSREFFYIVS